MDNLAFQALVRDRTSLKKVARDAVEDDFRRKKKRRRGGKRSGDVDSSDDEDDDDKEKRSKKKSQDDEEAKAKDKAKTPRGDAFGADVGYEEEDLEEFEREIKDIDELEDDDGDGGGGGATEAVIAASSANKKKSAASKKYRDRAKERREGKNLDYDESYQIMEKVDAVAESNEEQVDRVAMSKYLGGDEAHTHLVKGLDTVLANKVRREIQKASKKSSKYKSSMPAMDQQNVDSSIGPIETKEEAMIMLKNYLAVPESHRLDYQWHEYVEQFVAAADPKSNVENILPSTSGLGMDLIFATRGDVQDLARSWETPQLVSASSRDAEVDELRGTPLDSKLLSQMEAFYKFSIPVARPVPDVHATNSAGEAPNLKPHESDDDADDDDDIFGDAGEYIPPQAESK